MIALALLLAVAGTVLLVRAAMMPRLAANQGIARVADYGMHAVPVPPHMAAGGDSAARRLLERFSPSGYETALRHRFVRAGRYDVSPERMLLFRFGPPAVVALVGLALLAQGPDLTRLLLVGTLLLLAARVPEFILAKQMKARAELVNREIPDTSSFWPSPSRPASGSRPPSRRRSCAWTDRSATSSR